MLIRTVDEIKKAFKKDSYISEVSVIETEGNKTPNTCWILPNGLAIDATVHDHSLYLDEMGINFKEALRGGWIRKASKTIYEFMYSLDAIKVVEKDMYLTMETITDDNHEYVLDVLEKDFSFNSYEFSLGEFKEGNFKLENMIDRRFKIRTYSEDGKPCS